MRRALLGAGASLLVACSIITSFDGIEPHAPPAEAETGPHPVGTEDGGIADSSGPTCSHLRWPDAPKVVDTKDDVGQLVAAFTQLHVIPAANQNAPVQGFDLDNLCTCPDPPACVGVRPHEPCDEPETGVDNAGAQLFRTFAGASVAVDDMGLLSGMKNGQYGLIVRVEGYNGSPDDSSIKVSFFNAVAVNGEAGVPRNDGADNWTVDEESVVEGRFPAYFASTAYVSGGVLVAGFERIVLRARIPSGSKKWSLVEFEMQSAHLVADLVFRSPQDISLQKGTIAGRTPAAAVLAQAMRSGACFDSGTYATLKSIVCAGPDLPLDPARDQQDMPCDALSFGVGFTAEPAQIDAGSATRADESPCPLVADSCQ